MNPLKLFLFFVMVLFMSLPAFAQKDDSGAVDTIFAESYKIDDMNWAVNISLFNDEELLAISLPLRMSAGKTKIYADSTVFKGGRVDHFRVKNSRSDTVAQCVTIGLINDIGVSVPPVSPGRGRIATVFVSSTDGTPIQYLEIDTTTTPPGNILQMVNTKVEEIIPVFTYRSLMGDTKAKNEEAESGQ